MYTILKHSSWVKIQNVDYIAYNHWSDEKHTIIDFVLKKIIQ
jgi:hypothetical protein